MDKNTSLAFVAGITMVLLMSCSAQDAGTNHAQPHFSGQAPGEAQAVLRLFKGSVTAVDPKAMTLSIKADDGEHIFKVTPKTKYTSAGKPGSFEDANVGKAVEVIVNLRAQSDVAIAVNIKAR